MQHPKPIKRLIEAFLILPGIGRRTAEKFAYAVLQGSESSTKELANAIADLHSAVTLCRECRRFSDSELCSICADTTRNSQLLCVIADQRNLPLFEISGFNGKYFVLGGMLDPIEGTTADTLPIEDLKNIVTSRDVSEVVLAFNLDQQGEATTLYLKDILGQLGIKTTRPARGLTTGAQLEYADEYTLSDALNHRREV